MKATVGDHTFLADEPVDAGGGDAHPYPLHYVAAGVGMCLASMVLRYAELMKVTVESARCSVEIDWATSGSVLAGTLNSECRGVRIELHVESPDDPSEVAALIQTAEAGCHARALATAEVPTETTVMLNSEPLDHRNYPRRLPKHRSK